MNLIILPGLGGSWQRSRQPLRWRQLDAVIIYQADIPRDPQEIPILYPTSALDRFQPSWEDCSHFKPEEAPRSGTHDFYPLIVLTTFADVAQLENHLEKTKGGWFAGGEHPTSADYMVSLVDSFRLVEQDMFISLIADEFPAWVFC